MNKMNLFDLITEYVVFYQHRFLMHNSNERECLRKKSSVEFVFNFGIGTIDLSEKRLFFVSLL